MSTNQDPATVEQVEAMIDRKLETMVLSGRVPEIMGSTQLGTLIESVSACCKGNCPCFPKCGCKAQGSCGCRGLCDCKGHTAHVPQGFLEGMNLNAADIIMSVPIEDLQSMRDVINRIRTRLAERSE